MKKLTPVFIVLFTTFFLSSTVFAVDPTPDIKVNGSDGPVVITPDGSLSVSVGLDSGDFLGANADWWLVLSTPFASPSDWYHYDLGSSGWIPGINFTYQGPLFDFGHFEVLNISGLPAGEYTFYFGTDLNRNGLIDFSQLYYDSVTVRQYNIVEITEDIDVNTTWKGTNIYVIKSWDFYVNATLVIEPGAIVKFHPAEGPYLVLGGTGTIVANGTADKPIIFTSYKDDAHGGDTNGDGSSTSPGAGDWFNISTNARQGSVFNYCEFNYGGGGSYDYTLNLFGSRATVINSTFAHNKGRDYGALDASDALSATVITENIFYDNEKPLFIDTTFDINDSNSFHNPDNPTETNTHNGIFLDYPNNINSHISWQETEVPFVIDDNQLWVNIGASLTLGNDVIMKFMLGSSIVIENNNIINYNGSGVWFTSYKDDIHSGDTNGDGAVTTPADGDWLGIYDNSHPSPPYYEILSNILFDDIH